MRGLSERSESACSGRGTSKARFFFHELLFSFCKENYTDLCRPASHPGLAPH